jgi:hypothetical protein
MTELFIVAIVCGLGIIYLIEKVIVLLKDVKKLLQEVLHQLKCNRK